MPTTRDDRLQIRISPAQKRLLEEAAKAAHLSVSAFTLQAAEMRADEALVDRQVVRLAPDACAAFSAALERPASVSERLTRALSRPHKFSWLD